MGNVKVSWNFFCALYSYRKSKNMFPWALQVMWPFVKWCHCIVMSPSLFWLWKNTFLPAYCSWIDVTTLSQDSIWLFGKWCYNIITEHFPDCLWNDVAKLAQNIYWPFIKWCYSIILKHLLMLGYHRTLSDFLWNDVATLAENTFWPFRKWCYSIITENILTICEMMLLHYHRTFS